MKEYSYIIDQQSRQKQEPRERFEPVPLHLPLYDERDRERDERAPEREAESNRGVIVIDFGDSAD